MSNAPSVYIRELRPEDEKQFVWAMQKSRDFHYPFINAPCTIANFREYWNKCQLDGQKAYLAFTQDHSLVGVFNLSGIVYGHFQSAYLGYYAAVDHAGKGLMSQGLKLVLQHIFLDLQLHRVEANIQPTNSVSIHFATKHGFLKEGFSPRYLQINGIWCDHFRFAITYEDWLSTVS